MTLKEAEGREVCITLLSGRVFTGFAYDYTSALDNDPEPASISIGNTELFENEIKKIEAL